MEKISLYDLLSILLPGALLTLVIETIFYDSGIEMVNLEMSNYFQLTLFLSSSIFLGSLINLFTRYWLNIYEKIGLYTPLEIIYEKSKDLEPIKPFFEDMMKSLNLVVAKRSKLDCLWDVIYYELEANDRISNPKSFQSFYFFFRNFFTLGIILFLPLVFLTFYHWFSEVYVFLSIINLLIIFLSIPAAKLNRKKMMIRMFWIYYSLNK